MGFRSMLVLVLLAACGDDGVHNLPDAPLAPDAPDAAVEPGLVTVTLFEGAMPIEEALVYFQAADSTEVAHALTDASGKASAVMPAGGSITVPQLYPIASFGGQQRSAATIMGVKPGDNLVLRRDAPTNYAGVMFTYPAPSEPTATAVGVWTTCGGDNFGVGTAATLQLDSCGAGDALIDVIKPGQSIKYLYAANQSFATTVAMTGPYTATPSFLARFTNLPADVDDVRASRNLYTSRGYIRTCLGTTTTDAGAAHTDFRCPNIPGAIAVDRPNFTSSNSFYSLHYPTTNTATTVDMADLFIKGLASEPTFDTATRTVTWTEATEGKTPDFVLLHVNSVAHRSFDLSWDIIAPYTGGEVKLPTLVGELADYNVSAGEIANVELTTVGAGGAYDAVRGRYFTDRNLDEVARALAKPVMTAEFFAP